MSGSLPLLQFLLVAEERGVDTTALARHVKANGGSLRETILTCLRERLTAQEWIARNTPPPSEEAGT